MEYWCWAVGASRLGTIQIKERYLADGRRPGGSPQWQTGGDNGRSASIDHVLLVLIGSLSMLDNRLIAVIKTIIVAISVIIR